MTTRTLLARIALISFCSLRPQPALSRLPAPVGLPGNSGFSGKVDECLEKLSAIPELKAIIDQLKNSTNTHQIQETGNAASSTDVGTSGNASNGTGTGTTIRWNPLNTGRMGGGTKRDPCASLAHELKHAADADKGKLDKTQDPDSKLPKCEVDACREENRYRKSREGDGTKQREKYDNRNLPSDAKF